MDRPADNKPTFPGPWGFHAQLWGFSNVVADRDGRYITSNVPVECGPMLAAGPTLVAALERIAALTTPGSPAHEIAVNAIEAFRERAAIVLTDWKPSSPTRGVRIIGVAC